MKKINKYLLWIIAGMWILFFLLFAFFILNRNDLSARQKEHARLIGASYMTMNNEFYEIINEQISERVEAEGDQLILRDPALNSERQIEQIEGMLDMGIDVLVLTPVDWDTLTPVLKKAKEQGVYIVVVDSNVKDESLVDCTITSDNYTAGHIVGEYFLTQCEEAKLIVMEHKSAKSGQDRVQGFLDRLLAKEWEVNHTGPNKRLFGAEEVITQLKKELEKEKIPGIDFARSSEFYLEIYPLGADKGTASCKICDALGILPSQMLAIGDQELDIPMLKAAGLSVAMGNAPDHVKKVADFVTKSNEEDGVAYAMERFLF